MSACGSLETREDGLYGRAGLAQQDSQYIGKTIDGQAAKFSPYGGKSVGSHELLFGAALRRVRRAAGFTQEQLGLEAGVQRNFVSLIELGQNQPTIVTISKLARALGMRASELVAEAEREARAGHTTRRAKSP